MLRRGPIIVGDLQPIGVTRPLKVAGHNAFSSAWAIASVFCVSAVVLCASGAVWIDFHGDRGFPTRAERAASEAVPASPSPATFPSLIEIPRLSGPLVLRSDLDTPSADRHRSFLDPYPTDTLEQPVFQQPSANLPLPLIGLAPLRAARLSREPSAAWDEHTKGPPASTGTSPSALEGIILGPDVPARVQDGTEATVTTTLPADTAPTQSSPLTQGEEPSPSEAVVPPAPAVTASFPPKLVVTLGPEPAQQAMDQAHPVTSSQNAETAVLPILNPGPAKRARSLKRMRAAQRPSSARGPYQDTQQTASIIRPPGPNRRKIDAGAVARASVHRVRVNRPASLSGPAASSPPWTLPPALAPSD